MIPSNESAGAEGGAAPPRRSARIAWACGMGLGLLIATAAILKPVKKPGAGAMPPDAAALVNGISVSREELERAMVAIAADSKDAPEKSDRAQVLDHLIDQELLLQRAYELGMDRTDRMVRNTLLSAMVQSVLAGASPPDTDPESVKKFYDANKEYFARTGRIRVRVLEVAIEAGEGDSSGAETEARGRADEAAARLRRGDPFAAVDQDLGVPPIIPLPDALLPASQLINYLGPTPARMAARMKAGEVSDPLRSGSRFLVMQVVEREPGEVPPIEEVRQEVINEMNRRAGEAALEDYLRNLRTQAEIRKAKL